MKGLKYLKDQWLSILLVLFTYVLFLLIFLAFKIDSSIILVISILYFISYCLILVINYLRRKSFYQTLLTNIAQLDKAYYVLETLEKPDFYEGTLVYQALYEINKSMAEQVTILENQMNEFKEYIELWIHEVKLPISSLFLMVHNQKPELDTSFVKQLNRIEQYVEQVLYYVRSEHAQKDYLITEVSLAKVLNKIALQNKNDLLLNHISFSVQPTDKTVLTDSKWLEFIINQVIHNSIKYQRKRTDSYIWISVIEEGEKIQLEVLDNGIGISARDLPRVFEKSFTGTNGRKNAKSTGMGLYIVKNLCEKLGHELKIESKENEYTKVTITFAKNRFFDPVK